MADEGWAVVPIEPTREMLVAYRRALKAYIASVPHEDRSMKWNRTDWGFDIPEHEKATARWKAMIAAAPKR